MLKDILYGLRMLIKSPGFTLDAELAAQNKMFPRRAFWHAVLFYTAGHFAGEYLENYMQYGIKNGVFDRA